MLENSMVTPGTRICEVGDWQLGEGVIQDGDYIVATVTGTTETDNENSTVGVIPVVTTPLSMEIGDYVICEVGRLKENMVEAKIIHVENKTYRDPLPEQLFGQMHITKIVDRYLHEAKDAIRKRDIFRAKIEQTEPVIRIQIRGENVCGVLHALCPQCGLELVAAQNGDWNVMCQKCDYKGFRVLSDGFGKGYQTQNGNTSKLNLAGKRWGKSAEEMFNRGPAGRSIWLAADHRNDGRNREYFNFEGGSGGGRQNRPRQGHKLFVGGIAHSIKTEELKELFSKHGEILDAIVMTDKETGKSRGFGFVTFSKDSEAKKAIEKLNKSELKGRRITVNDADGGKKNKKGSDRKERKVKGFRLYVGGLPWSIDSDGLNEIFKQHGKINDSHLVTDRNSGKSKGFGFVTFDDESSANKAIESLNGTKIEGRKIKVEFSNPTDRDKKPKDKNARSARELAAMREEGYKL